MPGTPKVGRDKLRLWFMPTGWRPKDVALTLFPVRDTRDLNAKDQEYKPHYDRNLEAHCCLTAFYRFGRCCLLFFLSIQIQ